MLKGVINTAYSFGRHLSRNPEWDNALKAVGVLKKYNHYEDALNELNRRFPEKKLVELTPVERVNLAALRHELEESAKSSHPELR